MHSDGGRMIPGESNCLCTEVFIINTNILPFLWLHNNKIQELQCVCVCPDVFDLFTGWLLPQRPCGIRRSCNNKQEIYIEERLLFVKSLLITGDFLASCVCLKVSSTHPALTSPRFCHGSTRKPRMCEYNLGLSLEKHQTAPGTVKFSTSKCFITTTLNRKTSCFSDLVRKTSTSVDFFF